VCEWRVDAVLCCRMISLCCACGYTDSEYMSYEGRGDGRGC
jgi:hypothetical protein